MRGTHDRSIETRLDPSSDPCLMAAERISVHLMVLDSVYCTMESALEKENVDLKLLRRT